MLDLLQPKPYPEQDLQLRSLINHVNENGPLAKDPPRPEAMPTVSLMVLIKDEFETVVEAVKRTLPIPTEIIIGVDKDTDSDLAIAYKEAYKRKPGPETDEFFAAMMKEGRYASLPEIASHVCEEKTKFVKRVLDISNAPLTEKPTYKAAQQCLDMVGAGKIMEIDFNDHFSNARNKIIENCTGEIIFFIDGHEFLTEPHELMGYIMKANDVMPNWKRYGILVEMKDSFENELIRQDRIFKNIPGIHFERGIHNKLVVPGDEKEEEMPTAESPRLVHLRPIWLQKYREIQRHRMVYKHMQDKDDYSSKYYSATTAHKTGDQVTAFKRYQEYLELTNPSAEQAVVYSLMARIKYDAGETDEALEYFHKGTEVCYQAAWCWSGISHIYMEKAKDMEDGKERTAALEKALFFAKIAASCVSPTSSIAIPQRCYRWDSSLRIAEIYSMMGNQTKFFEYCELAVQDDMPVPKREEVIQLYSERQKAVVDHMSKHFYRSGTGGKPSLLVIDPDGSGMNDVGEIATRIGYEVKLAQQYSFEGLLWADIIWCEGAGDAAIQASQAVKGHRKIFVRCHPLDVIGDKLSEINWDKVHAPIAPAKHIPIKIAMRYGFDREFKIIPVVPNPDMFPQLFDEPVTGVVSLGKYSPHKWTDRFLDLASHLGNDHTINLGGQVINEILYEGMVAEASRAGYENLNFCGYVSPSEQLAFLARGGYFVSLSPWEGDSYEIMQAQLTGHTCVTLTSEWNDDLPHVIKCVNIEDIARLINGRFWNPTPREFIENKYAQMRQDIESVLSTK